MIALAVAASLRAASLPAVPVAQGLNQPAALDYQPATDTVLVSVTGDTGFETVDSEGARLRFGRSAALAAGAPVSIVNDERGQFGEGEVFSAYRNGEIIKLGSNGALLANPWAKLPGERGTVQALHVDRTRTFDGDVLAGTSSGNIWRIDDQAKPRLIASTGLPIAALLAVPPGDRFGPWAGKLLAATARGNDACRILIVSSSGDFTEMRPGFCVGDLKLIVPGADLFVAAQATARGGRGAILKVAPDEMSSYACQIAASDPAGALIVMSAATSAQAPARFEFDGFSLRGLTFGSGANLCQPERCGDGEDDNGDGAIDEDCEEICHDAIDNDSNGEIDDGCGEVCADGEDNDGNGAIDDGCVEICGDGVDNDGDGAVDSPCVEICGDRIDNDEDGLVDEDCPAALADAGCPDTIWLSAQKEWVGLEPMQLAGTVFSLNQNLAPLSLDPLTAVLRYPPGSDAIGSARGLVRAATAALLNAANPKVGYPLTAERVRQQTNAALENGNRTRIDALASVLDAFNQTRCTLAVTPVPNRSTPPPPARR